MRLTFSCRRSVSAAKPLFIRESSSMAIRLPMASIAFETAVTQFCCEFATDFLRYQLAALAKSVPEHVVELGLPIDFCNRFFHGILDSAK